MAAASGVSGTLGEVRAEQHLTAQGFEILAHNYRIPGAEIDLIARKGDLLVFAEVKLRTDNAMVSGLDAVNLKKMRRIYKTAVRWLCEHPVDAQPRFDVIEITDTPQGLDFTYIENAFGAEVCNEIF